MNTRRIAAGLVSAALLLVGVPLAVSQIGTSAAHAGAAAKSTTSTKSTAPPARPRGPGLMGTLVSASGNTLKIRVASTRKSATVHLTSKTRYVVNGKTSKTHPAWKAGEQIMVIGTNAKNGAYTATSIMVGQLSGPPGQRPGGAPPGGPPGAAAPVSGSVVSATKSLLVVKTSKGKTTFTLTSRTRYSVNGKFVGARPAFKAGQTVHVIATKSGSTLTAQMVFIGTMPAGPGGGPPPGGGA